MKKSLLPVKCALCRLNACNGGLPVCCDCLWRLQAMVTEKCPVCGNFANECTCVDDISSAILFNPALSARLIYGIKYRADKRIVEFLAEYGIYACGINSKQLDGVTYVPRSFSRKSRYGYDQSKALALAMAKLLRLPLVTTLKRKGGIEQKLLSQGQRLKNAKGKYKVVFKGDAAPKQLLLVDDITTTGATLKACKIILHESVCPKVLLFALAKTPTPKKPF